MAKHSSWLGAWTSFFKRSVVCDLCYLYRDFRPATLWVGRKEFWRRHYNLWRHYGPVIAGELVGARLLEVMLVDWRLFTANDWCYSGFDPDSDRMSVNKSGFKYGFI